MFFATSAGDAYCPRLITSLGSFGDTSKSPEQVREWVRAQVAKGADLIKIFASKSIREGGAQTLSHAQIAAAEAPIAALVELDLELAGLLVLVEELLDRLAALEMLLDDGGDVLGLHVAVQGVVAEHGDRCGAVVAHSFEPSGHGDDAGVRDGAGLDRRVGEHVLDVEDQSSTAKRGDQSPGQTEREWRRHREHSIEARHRTASEQSAPGDEDAEGGLHDRR